jgi:anti-sigma factor RsiW
MNRTEDVEQTIRRYLLGELSEPEQAAVEGEYFANRERFEQVCALENDLIDDYVRGNLQAVDREQFERRYLSSPERFRRVQFAGTMLSSLYGAQATGGPESARERRRLRLLTKFAASLSSWRLGSAALASLALILMAAVVLLGLECLRLRQRLTASEQVIASESQREQELERQLADQRAASSQLAKDLDTLRTQHEQKQDGPQSIKSSRIVAAFTLRLGLIRGTGDPQILAIAPRAEVVELKLDLTSVDFRKYSATLRTPEGTMVWKKAQVEVHSSQTGGRIAVRIPARLLPPGDYILRVDGMSPTGKSVEVGDSYFRVAREAAR